MTVQGRGSRMSQRPGNPVLPPIQAVGSPLVPHFLLLSDL